MDDPPICPRKKRKLFPQSRSQLNLTSLPYCVLVNIFQYLDLKTIGVCATLCSTLNRVSKDTNLYRKVTLKYNMGKDFLDSLVSKISYLHELSIEHKYSEGTTQDVDNYQEFERYIRITLTKCGEYLSILRIDNCKNEDVFHLLVECQNLKELYLYRCKSTFDTLSVLNNLSTIQFIGCHFPQKIVTDLVTNNGQLLSLHLIDNVNVNVNEVCEVLSKSNERIRDIFLSERKKLRSKSLRTLGRLVNLETLALVSLPGFECDPEDALEQIAVGCTRLERLTIYGWNEIGDDHLRPLLHKCTLLKELDLRGLNITIKSCREAALSLTQLKTLDVIKCKKVNRSQLAQLQREFDEIHIPLE